MPRERPRQAAFTLLEVCLALAVALVVMAVSIPSLVSVLEGSPLQKHFAQFDALAQEARARSVAERRNYVIVWDRDGSVLMRPEEAASEAEANGLMRLAPARDERLALRLPAALPASGGGVPEAIWTFWASGACEPAEVRHTGPAGAWKALYDPFSPTPEVLYE